VAEVGIIHSSIISLTAPDTYDASSETKNKAAFAISSGCPILPIGIVPSNLEKSLVSPETVAKISSLLDIEPYQLLQPANFEIPQNPSLENFVSDLDNAICHIKAL